MGRKRRAQKTCEIIQAIYVTLRPHQVKIDYIVQRNIHRGHNIIKMHILPPKAQILIAKRKKALYNTRRIGA